MNHDPRCPQAQGQDSECICGNLYDDWRQEQIAEASYEECEAAQDPTPPEAWDGIPF